MRQIKFRGWDRVNKKMLAPQEFQRSHYGLNTQTDRVELSFRGMENAEHFELMMFTGLLDKSGKEIYEGDICKQKPISCDEEKIGEVSIRPTQGVCIGAYPYFVTPCEVIGNIYENKDLL